MATSVIPKSLASDVNTLNSRLEVVIGTKQVTLPDGKTTATETAVNLSSYVPSGKTIYAVIPIRIGGYVLPYYDSAGVIKTYVQAININGGIIYIKNWTSAWNNYELTFALIVG